jgi:hypothetical protein
VVDIRERRQVACVHALVEAAGDTPAGRPLSYSVLADAGVLGEAELVSGLAQEIVCNYLNPGELALVFDDLAVPEVADYLRLGIRLGGPASACGFGGAAGGVVQVAGHGVDGGGRVAQDPGGVPGGQLRLVGDQVGDLGGVVAAVAGVDVLDDLFAAVVSRCRCRCRPVRFSGSPGSRSGTSVRYITASPSSDALGEAAAVVSVDRTSMHRGVDHSHVFGRTADR